MVLGDTLLFLAGKWTGWTLLGFLCKVSANPETCILRSAESFYKRGKTTLVIAKFIPGVNTMGPPLAGSMKMPFSQFVRYDAMGAALYIFAYFTLGFLGRDFLKAIGSDISDRRTRYRRGAAAGADRVRRLPHMAGAQEPRVPHRASRPGAGTDREAGFRRSGQRFCWSTCAVTVTTTRTRRASRDPSASSPTILKRN